MSWACEEIADRKLRAATDRTAYELHLAALEWSLSEPIIINGPEDLKSTGWKDRGLTPFAHQINNLITFCRRLPVTLLADDVGLGKTISAGLILAELIARKRVQRALVLCPKILAPQWVAELDQNFGIVAKDVTGAALAAELKRSCPVIVTTYDSARSHLDKIERGDFQLCIMDEAHKLRNLHGTAKPPVMALKVQEALKRDIFKYCVMLTATPIQNRVWDLYSLIDLLKAAEGKPNPLGNANEFNARYIDPSSSGRKLKPKQAELFRREVRNCLTRNRRQDCQLPFPTRRVKLQPVRLTLDEQDLLKLVANHIEGMSGLAQVSISQALLSSPRALAAQAENMARNNTLDKDAAELIRLIARRITQPAKLAALFKLIDALRQGNPTSWRCIIFTVRKETQEMIGEALVEQGIACGFIRGGDPQANQRDIAAFREDLPRKHVIISTDAGAEGVNLQVANVLINYDLPWNPMVVEQRIGRVQRLGSKFEYVEVLNLVAAGTVEDRIVARLTEKLQGISQAVGDIEGILDAGEIEDEGEESFEAMIRKLVVRSLKGFDVERQVAMKEKDIEKARQLYEEQKKEIDRQLGGGGEDSQQIRPMPNIARKEPKMPYRDFVLGAKRADGLTVEQKGKDRYEVTGPRRVTEKITLAELSSSDLAGHLFAEQHIKPFYPGMPEFERLVQRWVDRDAHSIVDAVPGAAGRAQNLAVDWCRQFPGLDFVSANYLPEATSFQGAVHVKARAGNGVDSYEKILRGRVPTQDGHPPLSRDGQATTIANDLNVSSVLPQFDAAIRTAVDRDSELGQFCAYYENRLAESLGEAGTDPARRAKVTSDFQPYVQAEVHGLEGIRYDTGPLDVVYRIEGHEYRSQLSVIPAAHHVLKGPGVEQCVLTQSNWPTDCLGTCQATGKRALRHRLVASSSGRIAIPGHILKCEETGDELLPDELGTCSITQKQVSKSILAKSELTGALAIASKLSKCPITGKIALPSELVPCDVTGVVAAPEALEQCSITGKRAVRSVMMKCEWTGDWVLCSETGVSDYSGKTVAKKFLNPSQRSTQRIGMPNEFGRCEETGRYLLLDELGRSDRTGKIVDDSLLVLSASGRKALASELVKCQETESLLLPDEMSICSATNRNVSHSQLVRHDITGLPVLKRLTEVCDVTKKRVLQSELVECLLTKRRVLPSEIETCAVSGRKALRSEMIRSDVSGRFALPSETFHSAVSGKVGLPEEIAICQWLGMRVLKMEMGRCELTGLPISKRNLNAKNQLLPLADLLDMKFAEELDAAQMIPMLQSLDPAFETTTRLAAVQAPDRNVYAIVASVLKRGWFLKSPRLVGAVVSLEGTPRILGIGVRGQRDRNKEFVYEETLHFERKT